MDFILVFSCGHTSQLVGVSEEEFKKIQEKCRTSECPTCSGVFGSKPKSLEN